MRGSGTEASLTALFVALFASPSVGADDVHVDLVLRGAVFQKEGPGPADPALLLDVNRLGGRWQRAWGIARSFNVAHHTGRVVAGSVDGDSIELTLEMLIHGDAWVSGGRAKYEVTLRRISGDRFEGTFEGTRSSTRTAPCFAVPSSRRRAFASPPVSAKPR